MKLTKQQRMLLMGPVIVLPFLVMVFYSLGGGQGVKRASAGGALGLNTELPGMYVDPKKEAIDKLGAYFKAEQDSMRRKQYEMRDPYRTPVSAPGVGQAAIRKDVKADELLEQLDDLRERLQAPPKVVVRPVMEAHPAGTRFLPKMPDADTPAADPQLEKLNIMLDKVIRIQHPGEGVRAPEAADRLVSEEVLPADSASNSIAAVIPVDETLVTGGTIPLRLGEDVRVHGILIQRGQWVYGTVTINGDRMQVHVRSLRDGLNIYNTDLQVYDLDGLPGIQIPGMLSRDVAKESADEGVNGLNVLAYNSSLGASAAEAGVQAAKTFIGRKVRLVRVAVRAGYEVLLRNAQGKGFSGRQIKDSTSVFAGDLCSHIRPPGFDPGGSFIERSRADGMELGLQGVYLQDGVLWLAIRWVNRSPICYVPDFCRWVIRDKKVLKRTAQQEQPLEAVYAPAAAVVAADSLVAQWVGFRPFALGRDKELVMEAGERNGGRVLALVIGHKQILHAKKVEP
jgi:hypothetical protein